MVEIGVTHQIMSGNAANCDALADGQQCPEEELYSRSHST